MSYGPFNLLVLEDLLLLNLQIYSAQDIISDMAPLIITLLLLKISMH